MNVLDPIARQVRAHPDHPALHARGETLSFRRLWQASGLVAHHLRSKGVRRGDGVALSRNPLHIHFIAILAIARIGAVSTSVPPSMPAAARLGMARRHGIGFWVHGEQEDMTGMDGIVAIAETELLAPTPAGAPAVPLEQGLDDEVWRITFSSGTTGARKSIPWTHSQRSALERSTLDALAGGPGECLLVCADLGTGLGLGQAMTQLASGGAVALPDNASAAACVDALRKVAPTRLLMTASLAYTLLEHLKKTSDHTKPFPGLISMLVGGSALSPALMASLERLVCPNVQVSYGSTEMGTTVRSTPASRLANKRAAGRLMPWIEAQAVDENEEPLAPGNPGRLRFRSRGPGMATRYLGDEEASARAFRGGWFYPGDTGAIDADGYLLLGGRTDDVVNVGGIKVDPILIEQMLNQQPGVVESAVVAVDRPGGGRALVGALVTTGKLDAEAFRSGLTGEARRVRQLVKVDALPKNDNGKVMRDELTQQLARALAARDRD